MPLRKLDEIPKLPKTRKKKPEVIWNLIPEKKKDNIEYICKPLFYFDKVLKKQKTGFIIESVAHFSSFSYEIINEVKKNKNEIIITLYGIKNLNNAIPRIGPAIAEIYFEDLFGEHTVYIVKQDGCINGAHVDFNIFKKDIVIKNKFLYEKKNNRLFCDFIIDKSLFTFKEN
jgi:hypothetical protein